MKEGIVGGTSQPRLASENANSGAVRSGWRWIGRNIGLLAASLALASAIIHALLGDWDGVVSHAAVGLWAWMAWDYQRRLRRTEDFMRKMLAGYAFTATTGPLRSVWTREDEIIPTPGEAA